MFLTLWLKALDEVTSWNTKPNVWKGEKCHFAIVDLHSSISQSIIKRNWSLVYSFWTEFSENWEPDIRGDSVWFIFRWNLIYNVLRFVNENPKLHTHPHAHSINKDLLFNLVVRQLQSRFQGGGTTLEVFEAPDFDTYFKVRYNKGLNRRVIWRLASVKVLVIANEQRSYVEWFVVEHWYVNP